MRLEASDQPRTGGQLQREARHAARPLHDPLALCREVLLNALIGGFFAMLMLLFFLKDFRSTLIIGVSIPISIIATFFLMYQTGTTLNIMSLGGLALGVGMLVDNAIVVLEAIFKRDRWIVLAGLAVVASLAIGLYYRELDWRHLKEAMVEGGIQTDQAATRVDRGRRLQRTASSGHAPGC